MSEAKKTGLDLLREPFPDHHVGKLPKPTAAQTKAVKDDFKNGVRCQVCGGWHHPKVVHLDYVGHAPLTDRFLEADKEWSWEPLAFNDQGLPAYDSSGGLWIKLTICRVTRIGYGNAPAKGEVGNREKEVIGDALRNAGMRFGCALDLWHKGDLHLEEPEEPKLIVPKRSALNKALTACLNLDQYNKTLNSFNEKYPNILDISSGHPTKKNETWNHLFCAHYDRIKGIPPLEANITPEQYQTDFDQLINNPGDTWFNYDEAQKMFENTNTLKVTANRTALNELSASLVSELGDRD